jgi:hypothetical protein
MRNEFIWMIEMAKTTLKIVFVIIEHLNRFKDIYKKSLNNFNIAANIFII